MYKYTSGLQPIARKALSERAVGNVKAQSPTFKFQKALKLQ